MHSVQELELRALLCDIGRRLWQKNLVGGTEGNLSVRLSPERFLCTPSGVSKGHLKPADLVIINRQGVPQGPGQPSSEIRMHLAAYARRPDCMAVCHAHPPYATAFSLAGEDIPDCATPEAALVLGSVATVPFGMPGTDELPEQLDRYLDDHKVFLLANHGATTLGRDPLDAFYRMETLERVAQVLFLSRFLGGPQPLPTAAAELLARQGLTPNL